jgi:hypothetical protein
MPLIEEQRGCQGGLARRDLSEQKWAAGCLARRRILLVCGRLKPKEMPMKKFTLFLALGLTVTSYGGKDPIDCIARVTNRTYTVKINPTTRVMHLESDNGYKYEGTGNYYFNPRGNFEAYYLQTGYAAGIDVQVELSGQRRIAFCLKPNECYLCK